MRATGPLVAYTHITFMHKNNLHRVFMLIGHVLFVSGLGFHNSVTLCYWVILWVYMYSWIAFLHLYIPS